MYTACTVCYYHRFVECLSMYLRIHCIIHFLPFIDCFGFAATKNWYCFECRVTLGQGDEGWGEMSVTRIDESRSPAKARAARIPPPPPPLPTTLVHKSGLRGIVVSRGGRSWRPRWRCRTADERRPRPYKAFPHHCCITGAPLVAWRKNSKNTVVYDHRLTVARVQR